VLSERKASTARVAMRISIIVPVLNERECICETLRSLQQLEGEKEIIVVDGGSSDETVSLALAAGVKVVTASPGRGVQMHAGVVDASGDVLWFVHADTVPPAHALQEIRKGLDDPRITAGNFGLVFDGQSRAARRLTAIYPILRILGLCYGDSGIFVRRETYDRIGGFRPLALFEDLDLLRRLRTTGRFVHLPCRIRTSSRRFEHRNFLLVWLHWTTLQVLYWLGVSPNWLARWYRHVRRSSD
jgi:rSAM/selenodomain-associated transferase 2